MTDDGGLQSITSSTADEAARVLAAAFATDPMFVWMSGRETVTADRLLPAFSAMINAELRRAEPLVDMAPTGGCVTVWHGIDQWKSSAIETIRTAPGFIRSFGLRRVPPLIRTLTALDKAHPSAPHYHLGFIGTDPSRQGTGLGSATLTPMLERIDAEGVPAYLESSNPANEAFYGRHGFVVTERVELPSGAPPMSAMWREPRT
jgi:ribosomal protein S18 acetylase RimI-like enzyme